MVMPGSARYTFLATVIPIGYTLTKECCYRYSSSFAAFRRFYMFGKVRGGL